MKSKDMKMKEDPSSAWAKGWIQRQIKCVCEPFVKYADITHMYFVIQKILGKKRARYY